MRRLRFLRVIGSGSFGTVYLAELSGGGGFRRRVAVKVLPARAPDAEALRARIRDEARLLGMLRDDAILEVIDMVRVAGRDAIVMEYLEGADLRRLVAAGARPPPRALAEVGAAVAGALARAHTALNPATGRPLGVVHRDVKPANVVVTPAGGVKLLDFGVARAQFESRESRTGQLVLGTLNYMAPEYIATGDVSPAADVYGLGITLWEAATGETWGSPKLRREAHEARVEERLAALPAPLAPLAGAIRRMVAWTAEDRPSASEAEEELLRAADRLPGAGLRTWAREAVPPHVPRGADEDPGGLVGTTVEIDDAPPPAPTPPPSERAPTPPPAPPGPRGATAAAGTAGAAATTGASGLTPTSRLVLQGVLVGTAVGLVLLVAIAVLVLMFAPVPP